MGRMECLRARRHDDGAIAVMFAGSLVMIIGFCGLALSLSQVYNRKVELQNVADTAALAAAYELDGTSAGVQSAVQKASARFSAGTPSGLTYRYGSLPIAWADGAIEFGATPRGPWMSYGSAMAKGTPNGLLFVKTDTSGLDGSYGLVATIFMSVLSNRLATVTTKASAVAGHVGIAVTPLGICTMRPEASRNRNGELEEFGFRRGVGYDLMQLNPEATASARNFLLDPLKGPGATGSATTDTATIAPFVCTGTMGVARVTGGMVKVSSPFPLATLAEQLNSRFDTYGTSATSCSPDSAPPDTNIKAYTFSSSTAVPWMNTAAGAQTAALSTADGKRWTVAGPDPTPSGTTAGQFGVLWSYAKAVNYAATPPAGGYTAFATTNWNTLYNPGQPKAAASYPSVPPYFKSGYMQAPGHPGQLNRRVLNVALLSCPVSGGGATVSGIGRFFMTVPTDGTHLYAEFAGLVQEQTLRAQVALYP